MSVIDGGSYARLKEIYPQLGEGKEFVWGPDEQNEDYDRWRESMHPSDATALKKEKAPELKTIELWKEFVEGLPVYQHEVLLLGKGLAPEERIRTLSFVDIDFNSCSIGDEQAIALAELLKEQGMSHEGVKIRNLYLADNEIGESGARALAEALKVNQYVGSYSPLYYKCPEERSTQEFGIFLSDNKYGVAGFIALARALRETERTVWSADISAGVHNGEEYITSDKEERKRLKAEDRRAEEEVSQDPVAKEYMEEQRRRDEILEERFDDITILK